MRRIDRLAHGNRWRSRHPGEKLFLGFGLMLLALGLPPWPGAAVVLATAIGLALAGARLPVAEYFRLLAVPAGFLLVGLVVLAISVGGHGAGSWLTIDAVGLRSAANTALRALAATAALLLMVLTTPVTEILALLHRMRVPAPIVEMMLLTYRFLALAWEAATNGRTAQAARLGYASPRRSIRSAGLLAAHILPSTLDRARRLQLGLDARGYRGELRVLGSRRPLSGGFVAAAAALLAAVTSLGLLLNAAPPW